jgi:hypothetical protein
MTTLNAPNAVSLFDDGRFDDALPFGMGCFDCPGFDDTRRFVEVVRFDNECRVETEDDDDAAAGLEKREAEVLPLPFSSSTRRRLPRRLTADR